MKSEHIEHIRTVHATTLILCFALVAATALARKPNVERALDELREVYRVTREWRDDAVMPAVKARIESGAVDELYWHFYEPRRKRLVAVRLARTWTAFRQPKLGALLSMPAIYEHNLIMQDAPWDLEIGRPRTLAEFVTIWDALDDMQIYFGRLVARLPE